MESEVLNANECGIMPGSGRGESNTMALQHAIDGMRGSGTIVIPAGLYEFTNPISVHVVATASTADTVRITGVGGPTLVSRGGDTFFVVSDANGEGAFGHVAIEGLSFRRDLGSAVRS